MPIAKTKLSVTLIGGELVERSYNVKDPAGRKMWLLVPSKVTKRSPSVPLVNLNIRVLVARGDPKAAYVPEMPPNAKDLNVSKCATAMLNPIVKARNFLRPLLSLVRLKLVGKYRF